MRNQTLKLWKYHLWNESNFERIYSFCLLNQKIFQIYFHASHVKQKVVLNFVSFFLLEFQNLEYNRVNKKATIKFLIFSRGRGFCSYNTQILILIYKFSFLVLRSWMMLIVHFSAVRFLMNTFVISADGYQELGLLSLKGRGYG